MRQIGNTYIYKEVSSLYFRSTENVSVAEVSRENLTALLSDRCVPRRNRGTIRRCTLKEACQGHHTVGAHGRTLSGVVSSGFAPIPFDLLREMFAVRRGELSFFLLRLTGKRQERLLCDHSKRNQDKDVAIKKRRDVVSFTIDLTKLGHTVESICQSSRPVSIRYSGSIYVVRLRKTKLITI